MALASPTFLLLSWPEPLVCLPLRSSHRSCGSHLWSFLYPCYSPPHLGSSTSSALGAATGTALAPGSGCFLLWDPCSHCGAAAWDAKPKAPLSLGTEGHAQGRPCFPRRNRAADGPGSRSLEPCSFRSENDLIGPWHSSLPGTQVLTTDRQLLPAHAAPQWAQLCCCQGEKAALLTSGPETQPGRGWGDRSGPSPHVGPAPASWTLSTEHGLGQVLLWTRQVSAFLSSPSSSGVDIIKIGLFCSKELSLHPKNATPRTWSQVVVVACHSLRGTGHRPSLGFRAMQTSQTIL